MEPGHLSAAQIITYLVGALQLVLGLWMNAMRTSLTELRNDVNAERTRLNATREEMLKRVEFREEMARLFTSIEEGAKSSSAAREALLNELSRLSQTNATQLGRWEQLDRTLVALNGTVLSNSGRIESLDARLNDRR